jgi:diguanylate cyclase (GGDEF)-like protein
MYEYIDYYIGEASTKSLWILFMDIDNFKFINDTFGHDVGDQFISRIGNELSHFVSEDIEVSRFGGDEFVISIRNQSMEEVQQIVSDIQTIFHSSISINDYNVNVTVSMGLTLYPNDGQTVESLLKYADIALYEAKNKGKNQCVAFSTEMKDTLKNKLDFQHLMKEAMNLNQFYLDFQPIIDVKENRIVAYEALIRWNSDQLGQVSPIQIINEAEETGDIIQLGNFVIEESCKFVNEINRNREEKINISINVSPVQLLSNDFVEVLESIVNRTNTTRSHICLEMTESVLIENIKDSVEIINRLRELRYMIALDDFGTGYSSLSYLRNLEIDVLKVDKSFIDNITTNDYDQSIVSIVARIAESRKLYFTAEGVETTEQLNMLIELGCSTIQGYYFSKPLSKDEAIRYIENYKKGA